MTQIVTCGVVSHGVRFLYRTNNYHHEVLHISTSFHKTLCNAIMDRGSWWTAYWSYSSFADPKLLEKNQSRDDVRICKRCARIYQAAQRERQKGE